MAKTLTPERVIDISDGYSDPEGFIVIKSPGRSPSVPALPPRTAGKAELRGKNLYEEGQGHHLIQLAEIAPGDRKYAHRHFHAETVWVVVEGEGEFYPDLETVIPVRAGMVCHAYPMEWHGLGNTGTVPLRYLSIEGPMLMRPGSTEFAE